MTRYLSIVTLEDVLFDGGQIVAKVGSKVQTQVVAQIQNFHHGVVVDGDAVGLAAIWSPMVHWFS